MDSNVEFNSYSRRNNAQTSFSRTSSTPNNNLNITFIVNDNENDIKAEINMKMNDYLKDMIIFLKENFKIKDNKFKLLYKNENGTIYILGKYALYDDNDRISKIINQNYIRNNEINLELYHIIDMHINSSLNLECMICRENVSNQVNIPCGHNLYCSSCVADLEYRDEINYCGYCGAPILQTVPIRFRTLNN